MPLTGQLFIGRERVATAATFRAANPTTASHLDTDFSSAGPAEVSRACELASQAFDQYRALDSETRAKFLETIADRILALGDELLERANAESGLPLARLTGERGRTIGQLRLFADELRKGGWLGIRIDPALPERKPLPRADLRQRKIAVGPVAVFGASNFPLAFSVAGGDTASALAAGCPVVVKGHPAHPGTSELVAQAITEAVAQCGLHPGVFSLLNGDTRELGAALVADPRIKAVGFTGSRAGGLALMKIAAARPEPIPVYAEMSSINPVLLLPGALAARAEALGKEFVGSLTLGSGQFCTNPGLVFALEGPHVDTFIASATAALGGAAPQVMLTAGIFDAYQKGVDRLANNTAVKTIARGGDTQGKNCGRGALFSVPASALTHEIAEEVFGASSVIVRCANETELVEALEKLEGQLTATLHVTEEDYALALSVIPTLERKAGRILANGWPTGVEVSSAMVHGGPFPATSDGRTTSVGTLAIERFLRPVCYQDIPDALLPHVLRRGNQSSLPHRVDGVYQTGAHR
ncbi:aldehyde dehydrogenase (NADP(+)) [Steroidobacter sp.]|uniref:aldehyde dehydrogenase (NADP(+)) n=1 Tax=Steroidobacter sp. TaxID=1978227 RepID=UPI001A539CB6|nr:aldehyde dehydrogenase (NADP(+)) [Steroidobacter sp.]MBL8266582.1 aldehyde dehydrogenase (NADP(+)) [Steroidobacter sp.]